MFFAAPPAPIPEPVIREQTAYYDVIGSREEDLVREMNAKGPGGSTARYWAYTDGGMSWTYDTQVRGNACVIVKPSVTVTIRFTLPRWSPPPGVDTRVVDKWNDMEKALRHHEDEHADISRVAGHALTALLRAHPTDTSCERLDAYLQARGRKIMENATKENADLDARTAHGTKEGVSLSW